MAEPFAKYDFENRKRFKAAIDRARKKVGDLRFPMGEIARDFYESEKFLFQLKSKGGFADLKPATKNTKLRTVGFVYPILKRTGKLEKSITKAGSPGNITIINRSSVVVGSKVSYAPYHQEGTKVIPQRRFVFIGPESRAFNQKDRQKKGGRLTRWTNIIEVYVQRVLAAQGIPARNTK